LASLIILSKKSNAEEVNDTEVEGLLAQAEAIFNNADEVLAKFDTAVLA